VRASSVETGQAAEAADAADPGDRRFAVLTGSPTKAMPRIGTPRARSASIDNRLWLIVPSAGAGDEHHRLAPAREQIGEQQSGVTGTSTPPGALRSPAAVDSGRQPRRYRSRCRRSPPHDAASRGASGDRLRARSVGTARRAAVALSVPSASAGLDRLPIGSAQRAGERGANTVLPISVSVPVTTILRGSCASPIARQARHMSVVDVERQRDAQAVRCRAARSADGCRARRTRRLHRFGHAHRPRVIAEDQRQDLRAGRCDPARKASAVSARLAISPRSRGAPLGLVGEDPQARAHAAAISGEGRSRR
jgi:hypothetical protein